MSRKSVRDRLRWAAIAIIGGLTLAVIPSSASAVRTNYCFHSTPAKTACAYTATGVWQSNLANYIHVSGSGISVCQRVILAATGATISRTCAIDYASSGSEMYPYYNTGQTMVASAGNDSDFTHTIHGFVVN